MSLSNSIGSVHSRTKFISSKYEFSWTMRSFQKWPSSSKVSSKSFKPKEDLIFRFDFTKNITKSTFKFVTSKSCTCKCLVEIKHNLTFSDSKRNTLWSSTKIHQYTAEKYYFIFFLKTDDLIRFSNSNPDKVLIFKCVMEFGSLCTEAVFSKIPNHLKNLTALAEDLNKIYNNSLVSDINLLVEDKTIPVHKSILRAISPVFAKMLEFPINFKNNNIEIEDIKFSTMQNFLKFLYAGKLARDDFESVFELYCVANKYAVENLKKNCADVIVTKINSENASRVLSLANRHFDEALKDSALKFMKLNLVAVINTNSWREMLKKETKFALEVFKHRLNVL